MSFITIVPQRQLGPFTAQATVEERHHDRLSITRHPVEQGAAITDHVYKEPSEVIITAGWSNSDQANGGVGGDILTSAFGSLTSLLGTGGDENYVKALYEQLLDLQSSGIPFDIITGKRDYTNMLFHEIETTTTQKTETSLIIVARCQQIIIVQTQVFAVPPANVQANPQKTAPTINGGTRQLVPGLPGAAPPPT